MPDIQILSPHLADLIAAGEVVERPASVVKELLENAVDAGASKVTVEIRDGGMTFLRVTDNGCGMSSEDARTAFLRHATSKLRCAEDLAAIGTMGFRGEALAAIASVSRIDLLTKTAGSMSGTSLKLEAGKILEETEIGCPEGTTIIIRDLFFNTPARMKFMKSDTVEGSRVTAAVQMQALAHPEVAIQFLRDGKQELLTPGNGQVQSALYAVLGRDMALGFTPVKGSGEDMSVSGFVSLPTCCRGTRGYQHFFVNGRYVKSRTMTAALEEAYANQKMVGKFPGCVLHAICNVDTSRLRAVAEELGVPHTYTDFAAMCADPELDGIVIVSPSFLHVEQINIAMEHGKHVFCEKPLGTNVAQCKEAEKVVEAHPELVFQLGFMRRFDPSYAEAKRRVDAGEIGKVVLVRSCTQDPRSNIESTLKFLPHSGGQFLDMCVHDLDLIRWFTGSNIRNVWAIGGVFEFDLCRELHDTDNAAAMVQCENGAMGFLFANRTHAAGCNVETEIVGTHGTLRIAPVGARNLLQVVDEPILSGLHVPLAHRFSG